jgi:uncharacterized protein YbjT (DUF2867 family)
MNRKALVIGATGLIGKNVVNQLLQSDSYEQVTILVRKDVELKHPKLNQIRIDFNNLDQYKQYFKVNDVFSCLGSTIKQAKTKEKFRKVDYDYSLKVAEIASGAKVENFLIVSAMGANSHSKIFYNKVKGDVERDIKNYSFGGLFIFRPSLLLGERQEFRFGEKFAAKLSEALPILYSGPLKKYRPIKGENVAIGMVNCALSNLNGVHVIESNKIEKFSKS